MQRKRRKSVVYYEMVEGFPRIRLANRVFLRFIAYPYTQLNMAHRASSGYRSNIYFSFTRNCAASKPYKLE